MGGPGSGWRGVRKVRTDECLSFSLSSLTGGGQFRVRDRRGLLHWGYSGQAPFAALSFALHEMADGDGALRLSYIRNGKHVQQTIILTATKLVNGGSRWWFRCPVQDTFAEKLFLPPVAKYFASRRAHNLTYKSCQESGASRGRSNSSSVSSGCRGKSPGMQPSAPSGSSVT